ncbi:hypothetical protein M407DRAFT_150735 [Tulasnella calospora MUT 4182]|uniref:Uncharacterized protein n=1 Tax=Tulasnella calospora MUT 4182 TaxID=1051891 RepID=A0A0C3QWC8_9AGAM|nr:hypothetical protein M407DRAFT_150735 [Tulasnella calospora MUT 4182]
MNQVHGPRVGGSPSAWQWRVDEASEQHCIQVVLEDALAGSIYESGAPENRVPPGPPYMSGTELKDRYCKENMGFAMIWRAQPSLSGFHYWTLQHVEGSSPPPTSSSLSSPPLSDSIHTESNFDYDPNTPASSVPSPYLEKFSPVIKGEDEPLPECDPEKTLKAKIVVPRGRLKDILYGEKESLFGFKSTRFQSSSSRPPSRDRTESRPLSQRALLLAVQETSPHPKARGRANTASSALSDATSCATSSACGSQVPQFVGPTLCIRLRHDHSRSPSPRRPSRSNSITSPTQARRPFHWSTTTVPHPAPAPAIETIPPSSRRGSNASLTATNQLATNTLTSRIPRPNSSLSRTSSYASVHTMDPAGPANPVLRPKSKDLVRTTSTNRRSKRIDAGGSTLQPPHSPHTLRHGSSQAMRRLQNHLQHDADGSGSYPTPGTSPTNDRRGSMDYPWASQPYSSSATSLLPTPSTSPRTTRPSHLPPPPLPEFVSVSPKLFRKPSQSSLVNRPPRAPSPVKQSENDFGSVASRRRGTNASTSPRPKAGLGLVIQPVPFRARGNSTIVADS